MAPEQKIQNLERELAASEAAREAAEAHDAKLQREVSEIAKIHQALLPDRMPEVEGVRLAVRHAAPNAAGGDYYDVIPLRRDESLEADASNPWLVIIADASGHGPAAAVIMAMIQAVLHGYRGDAREPGPVMSFVNTEMVKKAVPGSFTTAVLGLLDPRQRTFSYAIAGHHPPLLLARASRCGSSPRPRRGCRWAWRRTRAWAWPPAATRFTRSTPATPCCSTPTAPWRRGLPTRSSSAWND